MYILQCMINYNYIHRVYCYYICYICMANYQAILCAYTETIHISFHVIHSIHVQLCMIFCLLLHMKLCCLLSASIREGFLISSAECPRCCWELYMQYNLCIMDTLELFISVLIIRLYLIIQVSLQVNAKAHFGTMTSLWIMQVSLFSSILIKRFHCTYICRVKWSWLC